MQGLFWDAKFNERFSHTFQRNLIEFDTLREHFLWIKFYWILSLNRLVIQEYNKAKGYFDTDRSCQSVQSVGYFLRMLLFYVLLFITNHFFLAMVSQAWNVCDNRGLAKKANWCFENVIFLLKTYFFLTRQAHRWVERLYSPSFCLAPFMLTFVHTHMMCLSLFTLLIIINYIHKSYALAKKASTQINRQDKSQTIGFLHFVFSQ